MPYYPSPRVALIASIVLWLVIWQIAAWLTGCATLTQPRRVVEHHYTDCQGVARTIWVREYEGLPPVDCPKIAAEAGEPFAAMIWLLQTPLSCVVGRGSMAWLVTFPGGAGKAREYEFIRTGQREILPILTPSCLYALP